MDRLEKSAQHGGAERGSQDVARITPALASGLLVASTQIYQVASSYYLTVTTGPLYRLVRPTALCVTSYETVADLVSGLTSRDSSPYHVRRSVDRCRVSGYLCTSLMGRKCR
jgi:hypothetical protein